jgi:predicted metal-binding protein
MDQLIDEYGSILSVPPRVIRTDEAVEQIRESRAEQQKAQVQSEDAMRTASAVKSLSETDINKDSALREMLARSRAGDLVERGG